MFPTHGEVVLAYSNYKTKDLLMAIARGYRKTYKAYYSNQEYVEPLRNGLENNSTRSSNVYIPQPVQCHDWASLSLESSSFVPQ